MSQIKGKIKKVDDDTYVVYLENNLISTMNKKEVIKSLIEHMEENNLIFEAGIDMVETFETPEQREQREAWRTS